MLSRRWKMSCVRRKLVAQPLIWKTHGDKFVGGIEEMTCGRG